MIASNYFPNYCISVCIQVFSVFLTNPHRIFYSSRLNPTKRHKIHREISSNFQYLSILIGYPSAESGLDLNSMIAFDEGFGRLYMSQLIILGPKESKSQNSNGNVTQTFRIGVHAKLAYFSGVLRFVNVIHLHIPCRFEICLLFSLGTGMFNCDI